MMSSFIEWVRANYIPTRTEGKYQLLRGNFSCIKSQYFKGPVPDGIIVCYVDFKFQNNDIKIHSNLTLDEISTLADEMMSKDENNKSQLLMSIYTETDKWLLRWWSDVSRWVLLRYYAQDRTMSWVKNLSKAIINVKISQNPCHQDARNFLIDYLTMLQNNPQIKLTETYQSFISDNLQPIYDFLFSERESLKDTRFIPRCKYYLEDRYSEDEDLVKLYLDDPPKDFMRDGVHVRPQKGEKIYQRAISEGYVFDEDALLVPREETIDWPRKGIMEIKPNFTENNRKLDAIAFLSNPMYIHHQRLLDLLSRPLALPEIEPLSVVNIKSVFQRDNKESKPQCKAIDKVFGSQDIVLIQGPPGTGKTEIICEMILQTIRKDGRVLLTSPTNVAVDNVLERIYTEKEVRPIRIGHPDRIYKPEIKKLLLSYQTRNWKEITKISLPEINKNTISSASKIQKLQYTFFSRLDKENYREIKSMIIDQSNLVCGTCMGVVNMEFSEVSLEEPFDLMIVDEASKATLLEFLVPAVRARKWVLVGDHRQLAPYVSDFELRLYLQNFLEKSGKITKLKTNNEKIKKKSANEEGLREYSNEFVFDPKVERIMKYIRRYHEEFHNLENDYSKKYLNKILEVFDYSKEESTSFIEMVESSLGSCFHYFWRRVDNSRKSYLPYQHRMPEEIAEFLNESIYDNKFLSSKEASLHGFKIPLHSDFYTHSPTSPTIFIDTSKNKDRFEKLKKKKSGKSSKGKYYNPLEINILFDLIERICSKFPLKYLNKDMKKENFTRNEPFRIGIITFYAAQAEEIRKRLTKLDIIISTENKWLFKHKDKAIEIRVSIVDRFQGQEQEIIILSMVRSNKNRKPGFLQNIQRLNVGLSRARHNMFIIGDLSFFRNLGKINSNYRKNNSPQKSNSPNPNSFLVKLSNYYTKRAWVSQFLPKTVTKNIKTNSEENQDSRRRNK